MTRAGARRPGERGQAWVYAISPGGGVVDERPEGWGKGEATGRSVRAEKREERSGSNQNVKDVNNIVCLICALSKV